MTNKINVSGAIKPRLGGAQNTLPAPTSASLTEALLALQERFTSAEIAIAVDDLWYTDED